MVYMLADHYVTVDELFAECRHDDRRPPEPR